MRWCLLKTLASEEQLSDYIIDDTKELLAEDIKGYITDWVEKIEDDEIKDIEVIIPKIINSKFLLHFTQLLVQYNINVKFISADSDLSFDFEFLYKKPESDKVEVFW